VIAINRPAQYLSENRRFIWKFGLIGLVSTLVQIKLQIIERDHGFNVYWWSLLQGTLLANAGLVINKKWTFKERDLPWLWAIFIWNIQKTPHSTASMAVFGLLLQVSLLPLWSATLLTAGLVGIGSFWFTNKLSVPGSVIDRFIAVMVVIVLMAYLQLAGRPRETVKM
jgi:hypothetical protein